MPSLVITMHKQTQTAALLGKLDPKSCNVLRHLLSSAPEFLETLALLNGSWSAIPWRIVSVNLVPKLLPAPKSTVRIAMPMHRMQKEASRPNYSWSARILAFYNATKLG